MLRMARDEGDVALYDAPSFGPSPAPADRVVVPVRPVPPVADGGGRYGDRSSRRKLPVVALVLALHALLFVALVQARQAVVRHREAKLTVVNLTPPPPPPAEAKETPPPAPPSIVAPPPIVQTPVPPPPVMTISKSPPIAPVAPVAAMPVSVAPPAPTGTLQAGDLGAQMVAGKAPRYPLESRRRREEGTVVLSVTLGLDGRVERVVVARSSGFSRLDDAALRAVRDWRWKPMTDGGEPVRVQGVVEIPFKLRG